MLRSGEWGVGSGAEGGAFIGQEDVGGNSTEEGDDFTEEVGAPPEGGVSTEEVEEGGDSTKEAEDPTEEGAPTEGEDSTGEGGELTSVLLSSKCILDIFFSLSSCFHFLSAFFFSSCFLLLFLAFLAVQKRGAPGLAEGAPMGGLWAQLPGGWGWGVALECLLGTQ